jgi:hypothetical protein
MPSAGCSLRPVRGAFNCDGRFGKSPFGAFAAKVPIEAKEKVANQSFLGTQFRNFAEAD